MSTASEKTTRAVRLDLPLDVHRLLRVAAAQADQSMASYARDLIARQLRGKVKS